MELEKPIPGSKGGNGFWGRFIDHSETYGPHVIYSFLEQIPLVNKAVDLGAGSGRDLSLVEKRFPHAERVGIEGNRKYIAGLEMSGIRGISLDLERDRLPFEDESVDLFIANQILEHLKEIYWFFHEMSRCLKVGGHVIVGVPNLLSLHNRILMLGGTHPTTAKSYSAHIRCWSKGDLLDFLEVCWPGGYELRGFRGCQFYPFPPWLGRIVSCIFPSACVSLFFLFKKEKQYENSFLRHPVSAELETQFFLG